MFVIVVIAWLSLSPSRFLHCYPVGSEKHLVKETRLAQRKLTRIFSYSFICGTNWIKENSNKRSLHVNFISISIRSDGKNQIILKIKKESNDTICRHFSSSNLMNGIYRKIRCGLKFILSLFFLHLIRIICFGIWNTCMTFDRMETAAMWIYFLFSSASVGRFIDEFCVIRITYTNTFFHFECH